MYAIVETGGKQYRVQPGDRIDVERLPGEVGDTIDLDRVLFVGDGPEGAVQDSARVVGKIVEQARRPKIIVFKMKRRKMYRRKRGHRQYFTRLEIEDILLAGAAAKRAAKAEKTKPAPAKATKAKAEPKGEAAAPKIEAKPKTQKASPKKEAAKKAAPKKEATKKEAPKKTAAKKEAKTAPKKQASEAAKKAPAAQKTAAKPKSPAAKKAAPAKPKATAKKTQTKKAAPKAEDKE